MGCCETRDQSKYQNSYKSASGALKIVNKLRTEALNLSINYLNRDKNIDIWDKALYAHGIPQKDMKKLTETEHFSIDIFESSKYSSDFPIIKISFTLDNYVRLITIINAITTYENRHKWDSAIKLMENYIDDPEKTRIIHSVFEYSLYKPEFYEECVISLFHNSVLIGFQSSNMDFEYSPGAVACITYFSLYFIKEKEGKTYMTVYLHTDPKTSLVLISKNVVTQKLTFWCENLTRYLENTR
ncbi:hypothetical protein SteCoe_14566 [Stentor coeruleus]|uniref:START domain-containing protein n=1 Tax=Stentor coeruleus TaxID=5963 RepID=A0A1R2C5U1_9CILI|nr:hypothetical protein SteCoe_14566 [Stentor coeruleus]